jgi:rubredoxin
MIHFLNPHDFPTVSDFATVPMIIHCPQCCARHIDEGEFAEKPHHTHSCQLCGFVWRPAKLNTHGVQFLPGYKNDNG